MLDEQIAEKHRREALKACQLFNAVGVWTRDATSGCYWWYLARVEGKSPDIEVWVMVTDVEDLGDEESHSWRCWVGHKWSFLPWTCQDKARKRELEEEREQWLGKGRKWYDLMIIIYKLEDT